jgi:small subunit ribosomal protein S5
MSDFYLKRRVSIEQCGELADKTVFVNRVAKVVKGGKRFSFNALVVTGDKRGNVGFGLGKAGEVPDAIRKASEQAKKNLFRIPLRGGTIPHEVSVKFGSSRIVMRPAPPGTGIIAGAAVRAIVESVGIQDIVTKCVGRTNPFNVLQSTFKGLLSLKEPEVVSRARGASVEELHYSPY